MTSEPPLAAANGGGTRERIGTDFMNFPGEVDVMKNCVADMNTLEGNNSKKESVDHTVPTDAEHAEPGNTEVCGGKNDAQIDDAKMTDANVATSAHPHPYVVGKTIRLQMDENHSADAEIVKVFGEFAPSCVMVIRLDSPPLKGEYVLKLYDRRFTQKLRHEEEVDPWTPDLESRYAEFVNSGCASGFFEFCEENYRKDWWWGIDCENRERWCKIQQEAFLQYSCHRTHGIEKKAYDALRDMQGKYVPTVFGHPWIQFSDKANIYLDCPGILLEYIQGYPLPRIDKEAPREDWQYICDEAIEIVQLVSLRGILNQYTRASNFIIRQDENSRPKAFMVDFGLCRFRDEQNSVAEFRELQANEDEEGLLGTNMEMLLNGGFKYTRSSFASDLAEDFLGGVFKCH